MSRPNIRQRLAAGERLLLDGAMGSELQRRGVFLSHGVSDQAEAYTRLAAELAIEARSRLNPGAGNLPRDFAAQAFFAEPTSRPSAAQMHAKRLIDTVVARGDGEQRRKETVAGEGSYPCHGFIHKCP